MNRLVLIDGNAMMHRAYHALPPLSTPDGTLVNVVYGFLSMVIRLFADLKPTHMAVAFDRPGPTFRNDMFKAYQSQRPKMEDDFISQIKLVHDATRAFGIPMYELDGFEADDMIGTIVEQVVSRQSLASLKLRRSGSAIRQSESRKLKAESREQRKENGETIDQVVIVTGDRDILQLVEDEKVLVFMPTKGLSEGKLYGEKDVIERMGVSPKFIVDLKALMGDASDNYSGVTGIGPKTAIQLLTTYGSVDALYKNLSRVSGETTKTKLALGRENAMLSRDLATIRKDAPIVFDASTAAIKTLDTKEARKVLEDFHFPSLLKRLTGNMTMKAVTKKVKEERKNKPNAASQQELF